MDFPFGLYRTDRNYDVTLAIVDRITHRYQFFPTRMCYALECVAELYINQILRLHEISISIVSERDPRLTSRLWGILKEAFGTELKFRILFHPQTNSKLERLI